MPCYSSTVCSTVALLLSALQPPRPLPCPSLRQELTVCQATYASDMTRPRIRVQLQNPACVCRAWHTAAHEIRLGGHSFISTA